MYSRYLLTTICLLSSYILWVEPVFSNDSKSPQPSVAIFVGENDIFWRNMREFAQEVANDLAIDTEFITVSSSYQTLLEAKKLTLRISPPDFVIAVYHANTAQTLLPLFESAGIKTVFVNADLSEEEKRAVLAPREKFNHWLAHLYPDDKKAGYILADNLFNAHNTFSINKNIELIGIGGSEHSITSPLRKAGLMERIQQEENIHLHRYASVGWDINEAMLATTELLHSYPQTNVIWCASDELAIGASMALKKLNIPLHQPIVIGGIDWTKDGIHAVNRKHTTLTLGGHYMEIGWALILLNDFYFGIDFKEELGTVINFPMQAIYFRESSVFLTLFTSSKWKEIDFKYFSKHHNPNMHSYDFSLDQLLNDDYRNISPVMVSE